MSKKLTYEELERRVRELEADKALEEQHSFDRLIESIQAGIVIHESDGGVIKSNMIAEELLGLTHEQMLGKELTDPAWTFLREDGGPMPTEEYPVSQVLATKRPVHNLVLGIQRSDKTKPIWVLDTAIPDFDERGQISKIITTFMDISALKYSEEKYRNLFEHSIQEVHLWKLVRDEQGLIKTWRLMEVNHAALEAWGKTRSDIIGKTANEIFSYDTTEHFMSIVKKIFSEGAPHTWETYFPPTGQFYHMTSVPFGEYFISTGTDISKRKDSEMALRKSEHLLSEAEEIAGLGCWEWDIADDKVFWSNGMFDIFQRDHAAGAPRWVDHPAFFVAEDFEHVRTLVEKCVQHGTPYESDTRAIRSDGQIRHCIARGQAQRGEDGTIQRLCGILLDITERKQAEEKLKKSETLLRDIINTSLDYIFVKDNNLRTVICNRVFAKAVSKKPSDLIGKTDIENGWDADLVKGNPEKGIAGYEKDDLEALGGKIIRTTDRANISGKTVLLDSIKVPLKDHDNNNIYGLLGISRDITERVKAEQALQETLIDLELAQQIANIGNWQYDPEIGIPIWSKAVFTIYERDPALGPTHVDEYKQIYDEEQYAIFSAAFQRAVREGIPYNIELMLKLPQNRVKWIHAICKPDEKAGAAGHFLRGTIQDITERKLLESEKSNLIEELSAALSKVKKLEGILPVCMHCKNIRDDEGYWNQIELYIRNHSEAEFSHSICPECAKKYYPDEDLYAD